MSVSGVISSLVSSSVRQKISPVNSQPMISQPTIREDSPIQLAVQLGSTTVRTKSIEDVLIKKQIEFVRVGKELDALRIVAPLLREEGENVSKVSEATQILTTIQQSPATGEAVVDLRPTLFSWWERWREATNRFFLLASIKRRFWVAKAPRPGWLKDARTAQPERFGEDS
jgi:hypothetical protein